MKTRILTMVRRVLCLLALYFSTIPSAWVFLNPLLYIMFFPLGIHFLMTMPWPLLKDLPDPFGRETTLYFLTHVYSPSLYDKTAWNALSTTLMFSGSLLFLWGFLYWIKSRGKLMTGGPYALIRHPQYLGIIIAVLGLSLNAARPMALISWGIMAYAYILLASFEERSLEAKLGNYRDYREKTWFMVPIPRSLGRAFQHLRARDVLIVATLILILYTMIVIYASYYFVTSLRSTF